MAAIVLRAVRPVPRLHLRIGDRVILDPSAPELLTRWRPAPVPNIGAALLAFEQGDLELGVNPPSGVASLVTSLLSAGAQSPDPGEIGETRPRLQVVR